MLVFLFVAVALISSVSTCFYDPHLAHKTRLSDLMLGPESKLTGFIIAVLVLAISLSWFSRTIPPLVKNVSWILLASSLILLGYATNEFDILLACYLADSYESFASSAFSSLVFLRAIVSVVSPLFTFQPFNGLRADIAGAAIAGTASLFCGALIVFLVFGARLTHINVAFSYYVNGGNRIECLAAVSRNGSVHC
jgi:hypothetical protein